MFLSKHGFLCKFMFLFSFCYFDTESWNAAPDGFEDSWFSCLSLPSPRFIGACNHTHLVYTFINISKRSLRVSHRWAKRNEGPYVWYGIRPCGTANANSLCLSMHVQGPVAKGAAVVPAKENPSILLMPSVKTLTLPCSKCHLRPGDFP